MKTILALFLTAGLLATVQAAKTRTFTSADGSKTLQASVLNVYPSKGTAQIRRSDGRSMTIPMKSLSEADRVFLKDWYQSTMAARRIAISISDEETKTGEKVVNNGKVTSIDSRYKINVRNNGEAAFENIEIKYRVFYYHDGAGKAKKQHLTADGKTMISSLIPRGDQDITTEPVQLTKIRPLPASKCVGGT